MNSPIVDRLAEFLNDKNVTYELLSEQGADVLIKEVVERFKLDVSKRYIWEDLMCEYSLDYKGDSIVWKEGLNSQLKLFSASVYIVITDDEYYPWRVLEIPQNELLELLLNHRHFEFFILDQSRRLILFDTHDNSFLLSRVR